MKIKDLYIKIPKYEFSGSNKEDRFIGREVVLEKLRRRLCPKFDLSEYRGAYLVAGYRGMGKSTLVEKVVNKINDDASTENKKSKVIHIEVFLSQGNLSDYDLLRQMFVQLEAKLETEKFLMPSRRLLVYASLIALAFLLLCSLLVNVLIMEGKLHKSIVIFLNEIARQEILSLLIYISLFVLFTIIIKQLFLWNKSDYIMVTNKLLEVKKRVHSDLESLNNDLASEMTFSNVTSDISMPTSLFTGKTNDNSDKQVFQKFTTKELEFQLKEILNIIKQKFGDRLKILFIIDELDKLEPEYADYNSELETIIKSKIDSRREIINGLLANLKSFINTAPAKFVFIGGAEMYEASLADIADRESFYSSIFDEVFYINTFFKESLVGTKKSMTQMVDAYLIDQILLYSSKKRSGSQNGGLNYPNYSGFYKRLANTNDKTLNSLILYLLNRYLIYLTYRSNGSPKKLKMLIEENIIEFTKNGSSKKDIQSDAIILDFEDENDIKYIIGENPRLPKKSNKSSEIVGEFYLTIDKHLQYKSILHASIFLPFLIKNEHHFIEFNDKNLYLSAFLMDHILKFHKSAFSWRELELIPDIIIGSKGPSLRDTMDEIINYLSVKHIRETTNAMFQYKFRSRIALELKYISKISNESAAAFNFTYNESEHLKTFFKNKLKSKIFNYKENKSIIGNSFIHSLTYLNSLIAEIHFYDEDYGSAIRYYSDAIQALRSSDKIDNNHQKILFTRYRLLLSLCLEKSKNFDSTYSIIRSTILDNKNIAFESEKENTSDGFGDESDDGKLKKWEQPFKRMQLFLRPHLSLLVVFEKKRSDGITTGNLSRNIKEYTDFMGLVDLFPYNDFSSTLGLRNMVKNDKESDYKRIQTLLADYFQSVGAILFYKNRNFLKLYERGAQGILFEHLGVHRMNRNGEIFEQQKTKKGKKTEQLKIPYLSVSKVRNLFKVNHGHFYPSFSSFYYYSTSLGHLLLPFIENMDSIYGKKFPQKDENDLTLPVRLFMLENLAFDKKTIHILGGKQKELIALILSKLSDSILSCIGAKDEDGFCITGNLKDFTLFFNNKNQSGENSTYYEINSFEELFEIPTVLYFNILSSKFYHSAEKHYDSFFTLKKCLYILINHKSIWKTANVNTKSSLEKLTEWLFRHCKDILSTYSISPKLSEEYFFNRVTGSEFVSQSLLNSDDEIELGMLEDRYALLKDKDKIDEVLAKMNTETNHTISSIFSRAQQLKFKTELIYIRHKSYIDKLFELSSIEQITCNESEIIFASKEGQFSNIPKEKFFIYSHEMIFCYKELVTIINTYGVGYTMTNSYIASIFKNLAKWSKVLEGISHCVRINEKQPDEVIIAHDNEDFVEKIKYLLTKSSHLFNAEKNRNKAIEHYEKAISLHSEGSEYKRVIKDMYILEDDFNDGLLHFYAALERSLLNSGIVNKRLIKLKDKS